MPYSYLPYRLVSAATDNATSVRPSRTFVGAITVSNANAAVRYLHLYNKASAPTLGTDIPVYTVAIPAGSATHSVPLPQGGLGFGTGLALAITTTTGATPASGAAGANEITVSLGIRS